MDLSVAVVPGFLKLFKGTVLDDVVEFYNTSIQGHAKLYSDEKCPNIPDDAGLNIVSMQDNAWPVVYQAGTATYNIYSDQIDDPATVPAPGTLLLAASGLIGLISWRRSKRT